MRTVRTTMQPDQTLTVDDTEYVDLKRQGLLIEDQPTPTPAAKPKPPAAVTKKET